MTTDADSRMDAEDRVDSRKKGRREERDRSRDRERSSKDRETDQASKDSDRYDARERDRMESGRERRKDDRSEYEKDRDKEKSGRDKARDKEKDHDRDRHREKDKDSERGKDRGRDRDRDREVNRDEELSRSRDRGKDRDREHERGKEREKGHDHGGDRERDRDRDRGHERSKARERDHEKEMERDPERDRGKEKDQDRGKDREREKEKDRDRPKDREREKERSKDREKEKVRERDRERDKLERETDKSKMRDKERETDRVKEGEKDGRLKFLGETRSAPKKGEEIQDRDANHEQISSKDHNESQQPLQSTSELEDRLLKIKEERLKRNSDGASEILSWVSKTRRLEEKRNSEKEKAAWISKALEEQDITLAESDDEDEEATGHSTQDLAGVKILHGLDKVVEGGAVILTLKDQNILANGDINDDVDMLENVEIGEQKQRDDAYRAAKKKTGIYDDKFSDGMSSRKTMLPQYDDPVEDEGVILDEGGRFTGEAEKKLEELRRKIEGSSTSKNFEDLTSSGKISSDYYTTDEMVKFKKPKKKKSLRKKEKLDLDALVAEAVSAGLGVGDLGSRNDSKRKLAREEQERTEAEMRSNAYQSAYAKAEEASKALRQEQTLNMRSMEDDGLVFGEDYEDLQSSLEQARKLALKKRAENPVSVSQAVALLATANKEEGYTQGLSAGDSQEDKVVITEMEEFVLGLQLNEEAHKPVSENVFMDEDDVQKPFEQEKKAEIGGWTEVEESNKDEPANEEKKDITPDEIIHEVPIGKGLAGAFKLLQERGTLNEGIDWGGRNMDKKKSKLAGIYDDGDASASKKKSDAMDSSKKKNDEINGPKRKSDETNAPKRKSDDANAPKRKNDETSVLKKKFDETKEIRIERTDEFGRIMTPKEAFRVLSHKFHGKGPGKMKQEKRMKQYQEDLKTKQMKASDTPSQTMERMREAQARLKTPYLVLSGHVKPGQTSDPRSGFATVEKDHLGSLTPMLGNKKVEHFLGIRKPDSGNMGSPPAKKFKS